MQSLQHFKLYFKSRSLSTQHVHCLQQKWVLLKSMSLYHHRTRSFRFHTCDLNSWQEFIFRMATLVEKKKYREKKCWVMYLCMKVPSVSWSISAAPTLLFRLKKKEEDQKKEEKKRKTNCFILVYCLRSGRLVPLLTDCLLPSCYETPSQRKEQPTVFQIHVQGSSEEVAGLACLYVQTPALPQLALLPTHSPQICLSSV